MTTSRMSSLSPAAGEHLLRWALLLAFMMLLQAGISGSAVAGTDQASPSAVPAPSHTVYSGGKVPNPGTDFWREVRQRGAPVTGSSQVRGMDSGVLIDTSGDRWREIRRDRLVPWSAWGMLAVLAAIGLFYFVRGPVGDRDRHGGGRIQRFAEFDRIAHWFMALVFIFLAITGLLLLFGRFAVMPLLGKEGFAVIASASKEGHNLFGPILVVALLMFFIRFVGKNWYARGDMSWLLKGGGFIGKTHVSAGFFNAGEKLLFWAVMLFGAALCATGLLLEFDQLGQDRVQMQDLMLVHAIAAVVIICTVFGHIYLSTWGVPGTSGSMRDGKVDQAWAHQHHDRWHAECEQQGLIDNKAGTAGEPTTAPTAKQTPS